MVNCGVEALFGTNLEYATDFPKYKKIAWQAHQIKSQQALDIGTKVHGWIKAGVIDEAQACEESRACWGAYQAFTAKYIPIQICQEIALYDISSLYAGTCDYIGLLGAKKAHSSHLSTLYILDWKTSKAINEDYKMQVSVYKHMIKCLIQEFIQYPSRFDEATTRRLNTIIHAAGKKPKIVCGIVRLTKKTNARKHFEFVEVTAKEEKKYLREFSLMAKLHNHRVKENA